MVRKCSIERKSESRARIFCEVLSIIRSFEIYDWKIRPIWDISQNYHQLRKHPIAKLDDVNNCAYTDGLLFVKSFAEFSYFRMGLTVMF